MKRLVPGFHAYLSHPLIFPTLGLLIIFNSGTYLALLEPDAKKAILSVLALGTLVFPLLMLPVLYRRNLLTALQSDDRQGRMLVYLLVLVLYTMTYVYFVRLPLSRHIHAYILSMVLLLVLLFAASFRFRLCAHSAGWGAMAGLGLTLVLLFDTPLQLLLMGIFLAGGIIGTLRLWEGLQEPWEVLSGFTLGLVVVPATMLLY